MPYLILVSVFDRFCDLLGVTRSSLGREGTLTYHVRKSLALDVFHREEVPACVLPDLVGLDDPRVLKSGYRLRFGAKSLDIRLRASPIAQNGFHCDDAIETYLAGAIYDPRFEL
jgi:hypothetical protein